MNVPVIASEERDCALLTDKPGILRSIRGLVRAGDDVEQVNEQRCMTLGVDSSGPQLLTQASPSRAFFGRVVADLAWVSAITVAARLCGLRCGGTTCCLPRPRFLDG